MPPLLQARLDEIIFRGYFTAFCIGKPFRYKMDNSILFVSVCIGESIRIKRIKKISNMYSKTCLRWPLKNRQNNDLKAAYSVTMNIFRKFVFLFKPFVKVE